MAPAIHRGTHLPRRSYRAVLLVYTRVQRLGLYLHAADLDHAAVPLNDDNPGFGDMMKLRVPFQVIANGGVFGNSDILIQDRPSNLCMASDIAVVENYRILYQSARVNAHSTSEHGPFDDSAGQDSATRYD